MTQAAPGKRLGARLVAAGLVTEAQVDAALRAQRLVRGRLGHQLVRLGDIAPAALAEFLEAEIAAGRLPSPTAPGAEEVLAAVPARLAHLFNVYPIALSGSRLDLAVPPLCGQHVQDAVAEATGHVVEPLVLPARILRQAIERDYLGSPQDAVLLPPAGLATLVVEDELRQLRPLAPDLRAGGISADTFLRSVFAEAVRRRARVVSLSFSAVSTKLLLGDQEIPLPPPAELPVDLGPTLLRLARPLNLTGAPRSVGRFLLMLRGRRVPVTATIPAGDPASWRLVLGEDRLTTDDLDELFAATPAARAGIEEMVVQGSGLLLVASPSGGGGRRLVALLAERVAEARPGGVRVRDVAGSASALFSSVVGVTTDHEAAQAIQHAADQGAPFVVADEVIGPRTLERALLAAARRPVLAALPVADDAAALAWMGRQGLLGAVKTGLLRAVLTVLAAPAACACRAPAVVPAEFLTRFGLDRAPAGVLANAGCPECLDSPSRRSDLLLDWRPISAETDPMPDEAAARSAARAAGRAPLLDAILTRSVQGGADAGEVLHLLGSEIA